MKRLFAILTLLTLVSLFAAAGDQAKQGEWTGVVSDAMCGAKAGHTAECTKKCAEKGSALVLVNDADKAVLKVSNADKLAGHEAHHVKVTGTLEKDTLTITEVAMVEQKK